MKFLKKLLLFIVAIIVILLIVALFTKKDMALQRSITINKPKTEVFDYLKSLKKQNTWSAWSKKDPNMQVSYEGTDGTVGSISKWSGNSEVGSGEQEIKKIVEGERIETELRFLKPFEATNYAYFTTESVSDSATKVTWGFSGKMKYPMNLMLLFMDMDKMVGKDFEEGLVNLKKQMEQ